MTRPSIFITGAGAGIGRATAELFAARGWFVGLYDVADGAVEALRQQIGPELALAGKLDVRDAGAFAAALEAFYQAAGKRLDVLFNCAGLLSVGNFESIPLARHHLIVDVNVRGVMTGCHAALPWLQKTRGSCVVNMASASANYGIPDFASYAASKFAVKGFTEALDIEWARHGIRVMDLLPLFVNTPMVSGVEAPKSLKLLGVHLQAADVAKVVWRAVHWRLWPRVHWYPGLQTKLLALLQKLSPALANRMATKFIAGY